ncbi:type II toxin-antitoxin system RelE/ParE family toxin [Candidatus Roizmanbacteria bacterium]|nr:type II toxin-antitoxin system RelE/ParE family toxin [Candidatus Roizmanbacteria bacterium]
MSLIFHPRARKFLKKLVDRDFQSVIAKIKLLENKDLHHLLDIRKMANTKNIYRLRVGKIRTIFEIESSNVYIHDIDFRGNIY